MKDIDALLELQRASQIMVYPDEFFQKQNLWTCHFQKQLSSGSIHSDRLSQNVGKQVISSDICVEAIFTVINGIMVSGGRCTSVSLPCKFGTFSTQEKYRALQRR